MNLKQPYVNLNKSIWFYFKQPKYFVAIMLDFRQGRNW